VFTQGAQFFFWHRAAQKSLPVADHRQQRRDPDQAIVTAFY
jgi:hypothetical protein